MDDAPIDRIRHSTAHLCAAAVLELWPATRLGVGPVIEHGFFYDLDVRDAAGNAVRLTPENLAAIEARMRDLVAKNLPFRREEIPIDDAIVFFAARGQDFKVELLRDLKEKGTTAASGLQTTDYGLPESQRSTVVGSPSTVDSVSIYYTGDAFVDLCRGPHVEATGELGAFALTSVAGSYWRGKETNPQLQRIHGIAFASATELDAHRTMLAEAERRDHRRIGKELDLFVFSPLVGSGLPLFTPNGTMIRDALEQFVWDLERPYGYQRVRIPHLTNRALYETSGHWQKFADELFRITTREGHEFAVKPMNCPHHAQIYASRKRSYRELPIRFKEVTAVYRDEQTGELGGLGRVRVITQDDAHVFCRVSQIAAECMHIWDIVDQFYAAFGMPLRVRFSRHDPAKMDAYLGTPDVWARAEEQLRAVIAQRGVADVIDGPGEAAMYGPKIDFIAQDAIGRDWQLATIQLDFNMPDRFDLSCVNEEGKDERIVMVHRAILGSLERFMAVLIEHYAGAFPVWLAPVQVAVLPVSDRHEEPAAAFVAELVAAGIRAEVVGSEERIGKRIRNQAQRKIPYVLVLGDKELASASIPVRVRGVEELLELPRAEFTARVLREIAERSV